MKKTIFNLVLVVFIAIGIGYGFLREALRDLTAQTLNPLLMILFDILSALIFIALAFYLSINLERNRVSKPLAILILVAGVFLTFAQLIRYSGILSLGFLSGMSYPGLFIITGSFLMIYGLFYLFRPSGKRD